MTTAPASVLPAALRLGPVHLTVSRLDRSVAFYRDAIGLRRRDGEGDATAVMGTDDRDLLVLVAEAGARAPGRHAGLYHVALLYPSRADLARALRRLAATRTPIEGASDHGVSEALYLPDPDGNGLELYADRARDRWPAPAPGARVGMFTEALDLPALLDAAPAGEEPPAPAADGLVVGHVHLHVGDTAQGLRFYRDVLGFDLMADLGSAEFVAAGGYHHHLGFNTWRGAGVGPPPPRTVGLRHWTIVLDDPAEVLRVRERVQVAGIAVQERDGGFLVRDPWELAVVVTADGAAAA